MRSVSMRDQYIEETFVCRDGISNRLPPHILERILPRSGNLDRLRARVRIALRDLATASIAESLSRSEGRVGHPP